MLKKYKNILRLVPFGIQAKLQIACGVILFVLGIVFIVLGSGTLYMVGGLYFILSGLFVCQLLISLDVSVLVQTSPYKKMLQTSAPMVVCAVITLIGFTAVAVIFAVCPPRDQFLTASQNLLFLAVFVFVMELYMGIVYKYFWVSMVILIVMCGGGGFVAGLVGALDAVEIPFFSSLFSMDYYLVVILGYALVTLGMALSYGLCCLFYKKELSKYAFGAAMKRAMK